MREPSSTNGTQSSNGAAGSPWLVPMRSLPRARENSEAVVSTTALEPGVEPRAVRSSPRSRRASRRARLSEPPSRRTAAISPTVLGQTWRGLDTDWNRLARDDGTGRTAARPAIGRRTRRCIADAASDVWPTPRAPPRCEGRSAAGRIFRDASSAGRPLRRAVGPDVAVDQASLADADLGRLEAALETSSSIPRATGLTGPRTRSRLGEIAEVTGRSGGRARDARPWSCGALGAGTPARDASPRPSNDTSTELWIDRAIDVAPCSRIFTARTTRHSRAFSRAGPPWIEATRRLAARVPRGRQPEPRERLARGSKLASLQAEIRRRARHLPIRRLLRAAGNAVQAIKPCFMMSPLSVAQYLSPATLDFDLCSTRRARSSPVDAFGAIARGQPGRRGRRRASSCRRRVLRRKMPTTAIGGRRRGRAARRRPGEHPRACARPAACRSGCCAGTTAAATIR